MADKPDTPPPAEGQLQNPSEGRVRTFKVRVSGAVLMKIISHSQSNLPGDCHGQLLGLDEKGTLDITACYPMPQEGGEDSQVETQEFSLEMMRQLREVNVETYNVGFYYSSWNEGYNSLNILEATFTYQNAGPNNVVLVYDPLRTTQGTLSLKAYRLTDKFMKLMKSGDAKAEHMKGADVGADDVFEQLQVEITNNTLSQVFLGELGEDERYLDEEGKGEGLELPRSEYLSKSMDGVVETVDDFFQTMNAINRGRTNYRTDHKPTRVDTLLQTRCINGYCDFMENSAKHTFQNLYFSEAAQRVREGTA